LHDLCNDRSNPPNTQRETLNPQALFGGFFFVYATQLCTNDKNRLKRAFSAFGRHSLAQSSDRFIECVYFVHFIDCPRPLLPMPSEHWVSMAINTKGDASVLQTLFVMVGFAWGACLAD
jgi:hypothetical protein